MGKFQILTVLGAVFPHFCSHKRKIWHGGVARGQSAPLRQISRLCGQCVFPTGRETDFWTTE